MSDMATTISIQDRLYQAYEVIISGFVVLKIRHGLIKTNSIFLSLVSNSFNHAAGFERIVEEIVIVRSIFVGNSLKQGFI